MSRRILFLVLVLLAAGCGGGERSAPPPKIDPAVADRLATQSDAIADALDADEVCTAAIRADELQRATVDAINAGAVPPVFQEDLQARVNELVNEVNCPPPPKEEEEEEPEEDKNKGKGKKGEGENGNGNPGPPTVTVPTDTTSNSGPGG